MDKLHRETIQKSYLTLVQQCNIDLLLPVLVQKKVFSSEMILKYMNLNEDNLTRKRQLFLDIQLRGPYAFSNLVASLRETDQHFLANLLDPTSNGVAYPKKHAKPFILPVNENTQEIQNIAHSTANGSRINITTEPIHIKVVPSTRLFDDQTRGHVPVYRTHSKNRGYVLIINIINYINGVQEERRGAEVDGRNLQELFCQMGLKVEMHVDLTAMQMRDAILNFTSNPKLENVDMAFVIIMGHGDQINEVTNIIGTDNTSITTKWVEEQFDNAHCKALQKRPKIIMYQTCRGPSPDFGVAQRTQIDSAVQRVTLRTREDILVAHSTLPGDASHRDIFRGTWYIDTFCDVMMNFAYELHLEEIFKLVDSRLAHLRSGKQTMQTSMFVNFGFNKHCYMHPKIYMEDDVIRNIHDDSPID